MPRETYAVQIYKEILSSKRDKFPNHFWNDAKTMQYAKEIIIYLFEQVLKWDDEDIKKKLNARLFKKYYLCNMLMNVFNASPFLILNNAYPGKFHEWELKTVPKKYWNEDTAKKATIWLIEEKLHFTDEQIKHNLLVRTFKKYNLENMLYYFFNNDIFLAVDNAYPSKFYPWELIGYCKNHIYDGDNKEDIKLFSITIYEAVLNKTISIFPQKFWNSKNSYLYAKYITIYMIENVLNWTPEQVKENLCMKTFKDNDLYSMLITLFNYNVFSAINNAYPDMFNKSDLERTLQV